MSIAQRRIIWSVAGGSAVLLLAIWAGASIVFETPLAFLRPADDGYYYYDVVRSVWSGLGISTDGIHQTNGFHPLWFLVLLPAGAFIRSTGNEFVVFVQVLEITLFGVAVGGVAASGLRLTGNRYAAVIGALSLWFAPWRGIVAAGVEGSLTLALLSWLVYWACTTVSSSAEDRPGALWVTGFLGAATVLARLDTIFVVGILLLATTAACPDGDGVLVRLRRTLTPLVLPGLVLVGTYLTINLATTGDIFPITAAVKSSFPNVKPVQLGAGQIEHYIALLPAWLACAVYRGHRPLGRVVMALTLGASLFSVYLVLFGQGVFWWHYVSLVPVGAVGVCVVVDALLHLVPRAALRNALSAVTALILVVPLVLSLTERYPDGAHTADSGWRVEMQRAGTWTHQNLPHDALLAMKDSGAMGFYSPQPLMNLDGVISNRTYNETLCEGSVSAAMRGAGVRFVVHHNVPGDYTQFDVAMKCWDSGSRQHVRFLPTDEVYRGDAYWHHAPNKHVIIWRFPSQA